MGASSPRNYETIAHRKFYIGRTTYRDNRRGILLGINMRYFKHTNAEGDITEMWELKEDGLERRVFPDLSTWGKKEQHYESLTVLALEERSQWKEIGEDQYFLEMI
jgi:hypothetical protein